MGRKTIKRFTSRAAQVQVDGLRDSFTTVTQHDGEKFIGSSARLSVMLPDAVVVALLEVCGCGEMELSEVEPRIPEFVRGLMVEWAKAQRVRDAA